jgi:hypothetical protein
MYLINSTLRCATCQCYQDNSCEVAPKDGQERTVMQNWSILFMTQGAILKPRKLMVLQAYMCNSMVSIQRTVCR